MLVEHLVPASASLRTRFTDTHLPEGLLVVCLNKSLANNSYKFSADKETNMFLPHNIDLMEVSFNNMLFHSRDPTPNQINDDIFEKFHALQHLDSPIFGLIPDREQLTEANLREGGLHSSFPHIYFPFTLPKGGSTSRMFPTHDEGTSIGKRGSLDLMIRFGTDGSTKDSIYVFIVFFTDTAIYFEPKHRQFLSAHNVVQA